MKIEIMASAIGSVGSIVLPDQVEEYMAEGNGYDLTPVFDHKTGCYYLLLTAKVYVPNKFKSVRDSILDEP